ncbi:hypothetical protein ACKVMH_00035 [Lysobacter zhanggongensis]|uniref:Uncharacterized protein n=1 Tax=Lysobacter zhanggongensis TaxID=1774951 RepID=A0ABU7YMH8_9GAMM
MNWKRVAAFAAILFASEVFVGFIEAGVSGIDATAFKQRLLLGAALSLGFAITIFAAMSYRQAHRPLLHAASAFLLERAFSFTLGVVLPEWLGGTPFVLLVLGWLTLAVGLLAGTILGRQLATVRGRAGADA